MRLVTGLGVMAAVGLFAATPVMAASIGIAEVQAACGTANGSYSFCDLGSVSISSSGGDLRTQTLNGFTGLGVEGGAVNGEIDGAETIEINFDLASVVTQTDLIFLYEPPAWGDQEVGPDSDETARIMAYLGGVLIGDVFVNVTGDTTATTTGGTISNVSVGNQTGGGAWSLSSPFGSSLIDRLVFVSGDPYPGSPDSAYSDFAIGSTAYSENLVPEPASLLLLGTGLGLVAWRRRGGTAS